MAPATTYFYRVCAYNRRGVLGYSNVVTLRTPDVPPAAPSNLIATALSANTIRLIWRDNSLNEIGFKVQRKTGATGQWSEIASVGKNVATYQNVGLSAGTIYHYRVRAYNTAGDSAYSNETSATAGVAPPQPPSQLAASALPWSSVVLSWRDNSSNEQGFVIERKAGSAPDWLPMATVGPNTRTYRDIGLIPQTLYQYRARAFNAGGSSGYSNVASMLMPPNRTASRRSWALYP